MSAVVTKTQIRLSRRARLVRTGIIAALIVTAVNQFPHFLPGAEASDQMAAPQQIHWVSVRSGDSLWSLAQRYAPNTDPREWIDQVTAINNLGSAGVLAGQRVAIPSN